MINFKELVKNLEYISKEEAKKIIEHAEVCLERQIRSYHKRDWWCIKRRVPEGKDRADTIVRTLKELYVDTGKTQMGVNVVETFGYKETRKTFIEFTFSRSDCDE